MNKKYYYLTESTTDICPSSTVQIDPDNVNIGAFDVITSPNYPESYSNGVNCTRRYEVLNTDRYKVNLTISFPDPIDIEPEKSCKYDSLTVRGSLHYI